MSDSAVKSQGRFVMALKGRRRKASPERTGAARQYGGESFNGCSGCRAAI